MTNIGTPRCRCCKQLLERAPTLRDEFAGGIEIVSADLGAWYFTDQCPHACPREGQRVELDDETVEVVEGPG